MVVVLVVLDDDMYVDEDEGRDAGDVSFP